jgi:predicted kinase
MTKALYILVGPPAIGKSKWTEDNAPDANILNRDVVVERVAKRYGLTYNEAYAAPPEGVEEGQIVSGMERFGFIVPSDLTWREFDFSVTQQVHRDVHREMTELVRAYDQDDKDVVIDMTNIDKANRALYMPLFANSFMKTAVVFNFQDEELVNAIKASVVKRNAKSADKVIPPTVIDQMIARYEEPELDEGFDKITKFDNSSYLLNECREQHRANSVRPGEQNQEA